MPAAAMRRRVYRLVSLEQALADSTYHLPDDYVGPRGRSWLHRWGLAMGLRGGGCGRQQQKREREVREIDADLAGSSP